jgi:hypothetical protein
MSVTLKFFIFCAFSRDSYGKKDHEINNNCQASKVLRRIPPIRSDFNPVICHAIAQQDWFWTGFMTAANHKYLVLAIPSDHPHLFYAILSNVLKTKVAIRK